MTAAAAAAGEDDRDMQFLICLQYVHVVTKSEPSYIAVSKQKNKINKQIVKRINKNDKTF